jgi:hypothetical protein
MWRLFPSSNLTITPGRIVRVTFFITQMSFVTYMNGKVKSQVVSTVILSLTINPGMAALVPEPMSENESAG